VKAEFFTASTRPPAVYRGNPFQIEAGLAFGGALGPDPRLTKVKANQKPTQGQEERHQRIEWPALRRPRDSVRQSRTVALPTECLLHYQTLSDLDWRRYGLSQSGGSLPQGPLVIMVHMASVWVPFTSESKEAIADYDEIRAEIKLALQDCGRKLAAYLNRRRKMKYQGERRSIFARYIPRWFRLLRR